MVCISKEEGALVVKHCERFNLTPLNKWNWRILSEIQCDLIFYFFRYGDLKTSISIPHSITMAKKKFHYGGRIFARYEIL